MLAIIIPYFKITYFEETLESLARQTDMRFNVYIGDDASHESPVKLLEKYKEKINFKYHRFECNIGGDSLIQQWERCIALSEDEEWLMVLGDDDMLGKNVVEEFYFFLYKKNNSKIDLVRFNLKIIDGLGNPKINNFTYTEYETPQRFLERILTPNETITASEFVFSRRVYIKKEGFVNYPLAWFSDYATWLQFSEKSGIFNIRTAFVFWRLSEINISSKSANLHEIRQKVKSLFMFMFFVDVNYKTDKNIKNEFVTNHLNYLFYHIKFIDISLILIRQFFKFNLKFGAIIIEFILNKIVKRISKI